MTHVAKILAVSIAAFALAIAAAYALIESGEVLVLRAAPDDGHEFLARLWVLDYNERPWISTTDPSKTDWVPWLRANRTVEVERGGLTSCRHAVFNDQLQLTGRLNVLLNAKYRIPSYGSRLLRFIGRAESNEDLRVWIRLEPCDTSESAARESPSNQPMNFGR